MTTVELEIDPHAKTPSYRQLANQLREKITAGQWGPREQIPSITQLVGATGLAKETVRRAIDVLEDEGLVYTVSGRGTFVSPPQQG